MQANCFRHTSPTTHIFFDFLSVPLHHHTVVTGMVLTVPPSMLFGTPPSRAINTIGVHSCPIQYAVPVSAPQRRCSWDGSEQQQLSSSTTNPPHAMNGMQRRERRMSCGVGDSIPLGTIPECVQEGSSQDRACQQNSSSSAKSSASSSYGQTNRSFGPQDSSCSAAAVSCSSKRTAYSFCAGSHLASQVRGNDACSNCTDQLLLGEQCDDHASHFFNSVVPFPSSVSATYAHSGGHASSTLLRFDCHPYPLS
jgi:hypothetical protein